MLLDYSPVDYLLERPIPPQTHPRLVGRASVHRPHSRQLHSGRTSQGVDDTAPANPKRPPASVGQGTDARSASRARTRTGSRRTNTATPKPLAALAPRMRVLLVLHQNPLDDLQRKIAYHRWQPGCGRNRKPGSPSRVRPKPAGLLVKLLLLGRHGHSNAGLALASMWCSGCV